jgi:3-phenylpropionate/trans-cinnamate dioxygenase ferredoxin reductase subunit
MAGRVVIAGGGPAAWRCAFSLRDRGVDGPITLVCEEPRAPYDRTMVSKDCLTRDPADAELALAPGEEWDAAGVTLRLGATAAGIDVERRRLLLDDGDEEPWDALLIATGGCARLPAQLDCPGVHVLRTRADAERFARTLDSCEHVAIVGGGLIAGEVASAARARDRRVTMLEALEVPLARLVGPDLGRRVAAIHERAGVEVRTRTAVEQVRPLGDGFEVVLRGQPPLRADAVVVAIGMAPATAWLSGVPGLTVDDGVVTDECCRTGVRGVFAAGDCARWRNPRLGRLTRVEHWDSAVRHGEAAAAAIAGTPEPYAPIPFVWSTQHGTRFHWVGQTGDAERVDVEDSESGGLVARWSRRDGELVGAFAIDDPRSIARLRRELARAPVPAATQEMQTT